MNVNVYDKPILPIKENGSSRIKKVTRIKKALKRAFFIRVT